MDPLEQISAAFEQAGLELYLVGGALRDELLGRVHEDLDLATNAIPSQTVVVLETIPDISIYRLGERYGTIGAVLDGRTVEVTTYRSAETYRPESRKPDVVYGETILDDLSRRDFTINAIARRLQPASGPDERYVDPFDGRQDLARGLVRSVGNPERRFDEDPLRLLRAVRFSATLNFEIEADTWAAISKLASRLTSISRERVAEELSRMLLGPNPSRAFALLRDSRLLAAAVPELMDLDLMPDQGPHHAYSLWDHTFRVVEGVPDDLTLRWAALLHDIAKPETMSREPDGRLRFYGHEDLGAEKAVRVLKSLKAGNDLIDSVRLLIETHMQIHQYTDEWSDGAVRRLIWKLDPHFERAIALARSDALGHDHSAWTYSGVDKLADRAVRVIEEVPVADSPLDGDELMAHFQRPPGPWIKEIKSLLTDMVADGSLAAGDKAAAWTVAEEIEARFAQ